MTGTNFEIVLIRITTTKKNENEKEQNKKKTLEFIECVKRYAIVDDLNAHMVKWSNCLPLLRNLYIFSLAILTNEAKNLL